MKRPGSNTPIVQRSAYPACALPRAPVPVAGPYRPESEPRFSGVIFMPRRASVSPGPTSATALVSGAAVSPPAAVAPPVRPEQAPAPCSLTRLLPPRNQQSAPFGYPPIAARAARHAATSRVTSPPPRRAAVSSACSSMCSARSRPSGRPRAMSVRAPLVVEDVCEQHQVPLLPIGPAEARVA